MQSAKRAAGDDAMKVGGRFVDGVAVQFATLVGSPAERPRARLLIESLRKFGGELADSPFWVFEPDSWTAPRSGMAGGGVQIVPFRVPAVLQQTWFADKVFACARAEEYAGNTDALVWVDADCFIINPPTSLVPGEGCDAALRPVHVRNVGLPAGELPNAYWERIYQAAGEPPPEAVVESFVDGQTLRAYFNTHAFAINPALGLMRRWSEIFTSLASDRDYQRRACSGRQEQIFLFQAVLSALLASSLPWERIRILPPEYNYPYHLHASIPEGRRAKSLNDLAVVVYEEQALNPEKVDDIGMDEPLRSWLQAAFHE